MYNKILAPLDGSKISECSLEHIKEIATGCHVSEVILLMVIEQPPPIHVEYSSRTQIEEETQRKEKERERVREKAERYLSGINENLTKEGVAARNVIIEAEEANSVAELILEYAESHGINLIVMSTHGRSGIARWAFGSIADRVVRHSKVPVLTVAPAGCRK